MKILAIKLREIGDTVIWTSAIVALKQKFPQAEIDVLTLSPNESVLRGHEDIDRLHLIKKRSGPALLMKLVQLRSQSYDLALGFHASSSLCRFIRWVGAKEYIVHHHSRTQTPKVSDHQLEKPGVLQNALLRDYEILKPLGIKGDPLPTKICISDIEKKWADERLQRAGVDPIRQTLALLPGARGQTRRYSLENWKKIFESLVARDIPCVVLVDKELSRQWNLQELCQSYGIPLVDDVNLRQFISLISRCHRSICMDSSPLHLSVALGLNTYCLFGPGCVGDWHPYSKKKHQVFRLDVDCRLEGPRDQDEFQYCTVSECEHMSCMKHDPRVIVENII